LPKTKYICIQYIYFLLSCSPGAAAWVDIKRCMPQSPHLLPPHLPLYLHGCLPSLSCSCPGSCFSLPAVAYFNPPRWWRAYIIHNYRFHFCLPVIIVAFLDFFFIFYFLFFPPITNNEALRFFITLLFAVVVVGCCCCCCR